MLENLGDRKDRDGPTLRVADFDARFPQWCAEVHELPHEVACTIFCFGKRVFQAGELGPFLVAGHSTRIAEVYEIMGHCAFELGANPIKRFKTNRVPCRALRVATSAGWWRQRLEGFRLSF
jgi:hypothetical protein